MPLYEYRCMACRSVTSYMCPAAKRNEPATCPECGMPARRVISIPQKPVIARARSAEEIHRDKETWR